MVGEEVGEVVGEVVGDNDGLYDGETVGLQVPQSLKTTLLVSHGAYSLGL